MKISDIFNISYGQKIYHSKFWIEDKIGRIPLISSSSTKRGVYGFFDIEPKFSKVISVASTGSVGSSFYHGYKCCIDDNCLVLQPKIQLTEEEMIYISNLINKDSYRYMYGRQVTPHRIGKIIIPKFPKNFKEIKLPNLDDLKNSLNSKKEISLKKLNWKEFELKEFFDIKKGERLTKQNRKKGRVNLPLVVASSEENGVVDYISYEKFKDSKNIFEKNITIDMFYNTFYHNYKYFSDDNVHTLLSKINLNKYVLLFLVTILKKNKYRYAYGRQARISRIEKERIKLPINSYNQPDWQFMEDYIKSLPYSANL